ncbi:S8 family serine peptidase [Prosthecobacter fluviatilis]|uniref:S8 family serine peptidase n=1 Tax=Prosthecobacter fluviatilis TaxID=445931 RepID=A0ABW0KVJ1_9BACT
MAPSPSLGKVILSTLALSVSWIQPLRAQTGAGDPAALLTAVEKADTDRVRQLLLSSAKPDVRNASGETPLMLAAKAGSFEICRALLWAGADANLTDKSGKKARDLLKKDAAGFSAVNLLLRCYSFVQEHPEAPAKITRPGLVMISDCFIDHDHKDIKPRYWTNTAEATGKPGLDDDRNGFIDDIYGWNAAADEPLRAPLMANMADGSSATLLRKFVTLYNRSEVESYDTGSTEWKGLKLDDLRKGYENPLVRQLGLDTLMDEGVDIDDLTFTNMLVSASHGTHVAGIVLKASNSTAQVHGMIHGRFQTPKEAVTDLIALAHRLAPRTVTYEQFVMQLRKTLLSDALKHGARRSAYLRSTGAGVANLSWMQSRKWFTGVASDIKDIYQEHGMDPDSIENYTCPIGLDLCGDLGLELLVNAAAELALMIHQNPDVLFVLAAGNDSEDNDAGYPSPAYLSRFFPNVITVASVSAENKLSDFSNYGTASVQVAAPGEKILSFLLADQAGFMSGTSMAAPAVAGLAARIRTEHPQLTAVDVRLILERSVTALESLQEAVATSGVVNPQAALALAAQWQPGSRADLTLAALTPPRQAAEEKSDEAPPEPETPDHTDDEALTTTPADKGARISAIGGFATQWRIITSTGTGFTQQAAHPVGKLPLDWIKQKWQDGWEITSLGGENEKWRVVMSATGRTAREQKLLGLDFDPSSIDQLRSIGYHITSHAGFSTSWVFVLTAGTGWKDQRYHLPGPWNEERSRWISQNMKAGYRITSLAGDEYSKDRSQDTWSVIMTQGTAYGEQVLTGPGPWPQEWITEHEKKGYRITHCTGYDSHWVVVMTQNTSLDRQTPSPGTAWDDAWVQEQWRGKN